MSLKSKLFAALSFLVLSMIFTSCGEEKKPLVKAEENTGSERASLAPGTNNVQDAPIKTICMLYMRTTKFIELASKRNGNGRKLMFEFCFTPAYKDTLTLRGWAGKNDEEYSDDTAKYILDVVKPDADTYEDEIYFGAQKIPKDDVNALLAEARKPANNFVLFDPEYNPSTKHIFYNVYVVPQLPQKASSSPLVTDSAFLAPLAPIATNPSPPASSRNNRRD